MQSQIDARADELLGKIATLRSNPHYRIADVFHCRGLRWQDSCAKVRALPEFEGTIFRAYLDANDGCERPSLELLADLIRAAGASGRYRLPADDELVVHVRAGDVINVDADWLAERDRVPALAAMSSRPPKCVLVTCFAFQEFIERGLFLYSDETHARCVQQMRTLLSRLLTAFPEVSFDIYSNRDVDRDLVFMTHARHFVRDKGGFSDLLCELRPLVCGVSETC